MFQFESEYLRLSLSSLSRVLLQELRSMEDVWMVSGINGNRKPAVEKMCRSECRVPGYAGRVRFSVLLFCILVVTHLPVVRKKIRFHFLTVVRFHPDVFWKL